jgi:hypothetical protein
MQNLMMNFYRRSLKNFYRRSLKYVRTARINSLGPSNSLFSASYRLDVKSSSFRRYSLWDSRKLNALYNFSGKFGTEHDTWRRTNSESIISIIPERRSYARSFYFRVIHVSTIRDFDTVIPAEAAILGKRIMGD